MKIQCDVCEKAAATVICCADEAALCGRCDIQVHAANKLASKHQRLLLDSLSNKLPPCDICQEKAAFIFCVEDRALFCKDCDEPIHSPGTLSANHQRLLATGIRLASNSTTCSSLNNNPPLDLHPTPNHTSSAQPTHTQQTQTQTQTQTPPKLPIHHHQQHQLQPSSFGSAWAVDDLLHFSDFGSSPAKKELGEFEWLSDMGLFDDHHLNLAEEALAAGEVPQLPLSPPTVTITSFRPTTKSTMPYYKKPRIDIPYEDDELFMVPDIG